MRHTMTPELKTARNTAKRGDEIERLRATLLNIQAMAERGFPIDNAKLAEQCRQAREPR